MARRDSTRAFTLVETLAAMLVLAVLAVGTMGMISRAGTAYHAAATDAELSGEVAAALDRVERALREIPGKGGGAADLSLVDAEEIAWNAGGVLCRLRLDEAKQVTLTDGAGDGVLVGMAGMFAVRAFDESNAELPLPLSGTDADAVRRVEVSFSAYRAERTVMVRTKVFLRACMEGGS